MTSQTSMNVLVRSIFRITEAELKVIVSSLGHWGRGRGLLRRRGVGSIPLVQVQRVTIIEHLYIKLFDSLVQLQRKNDCKSENKGLG